MKITPNKLRTERKAYRESLAAYVQARTAFIEAKLRAGVAAEHLTKGDDYLTVSRACGAALIARDDWNMGLNRLRRFERAECEVGAAWSERGLDNVRRAIR